MKTIKRILTSVLLVPPTIAMIYLISNLLLAFTLEMFRLMDIYKQTQSLDVFKQFKQTIDSAFVYQSDYQLYYIFVGVLSLFGIVKMLIYIFTKMYIPKRKYVRSSNSNRDTDKVTKDVVAVSGEDEEGNKEILEKILEEVQGRKKENRYFQPEFGRVDELAVDGVNSSDIQGFKLESSSPDREFTEIVQGVGKEESKVSEVEQYTFHVADSDNKIGKIIDGIKGTENEQED